MVTIRCPIEVKCIANQNHKSIGSELRFLVSKVYL